MSHNYGGYGGTIEPSGSDAEGGPTALETTQDPAPSSVSSDLSTSVTMTSAAQATAVSAQLPDEILDQPDPEPQADEPMEDSSDDATGDNTDLAAAGDADKPEIKEDDSEIKAEPGAGDAASDGRPKQLSATAPEFVPRGYAQQQPQPLDTPDSTSKNNSNGTRSCNSMTMEGDNTDANDNVSDEMEKSKIKSSYGRLSLRKMRRESNKTVTKSAKHSRGCSVSHSLLRPPSTPRQSRYSPLPRRPNAPISQKKQEKITESEDNAEQKSRTLCSGIITNEPQVVEVVDLTETDDESEPRKEEDKFTSRRSGCKATLSPAHESLDSADRNRDHMSPEPNKL